MEDFKDRFAIFIISHQRADNVKTLDTIKNDGYTGEWYIVIDDLDDEREEYIERYGEDRILVFDKEKVREKIDSGDNLPEMNSPIYAREKVFDLAEDLGYEYFMVLDDDYGTFRYRFDSDLNYINTTCSIDDLDYVFEKFAEFYEKSGVEAITFSQGGDFIGGKESSLAQKIRTKRKAMNTWMLSTERRFSFVGKMNDDVNTYIRQQQLGKIMFMVNHISIDQVETQQQKGGLTELYLDMGTYNKSFYTVLYSPSSIRLYMLVGTSGARRVHHKIDWDKSVPKILSEKYKKD